MQADLERGKAASGLRGVGRFTVLAGASLIAALALSISDPALAACGPSRPAGVHAAASGVGSVHTTTSIVAPSGGGGGGSLGCANGSSASGMRGLPVSASGRVLENGVRGAAHTRTAIARGATTRTANTSVHVRGVRPPHA
jgi:hypothetical protein